jgi:hypothetical protein
MCWDREIQSSLKNREFVAFFRNDWNTLNSRRSGTDHRNTFTTDINAPMEPTAGVITTTRKTLKSSA